MTRRSLPPGAKWVTTPSGARRVEVVLDVGLDPATGKRRQTRRRFKTVAEANEAHSKIREASREGTYVSGSNTTVEQVCTDWLRAKRVRASTRAGYRDVLKPVLTAYGSLPVQQLAKGHLIELVDGLTAGTLKRSNGRSRRPWKGRTANLMLFTIGQVLDDAIKQGLIVRNVAALVDRRAQVKEEMQTYTPTEVRKVLAKARNDRLEPAWHLALYGLRRGEIAGLRWPDIDFAAKALKVNEPRVSVDGEVVSSEPKTECSQRTLPLTDGLITVLKRAKSRQAGERLRAGTAYRDTGYVIVDEIGKPLHPETISDRWDQLVKSANVRRIRLHDARHTCGTLMHLEGVPVAVISAWLGHADPAFTMRTYVHSQDAALIDAARALGSLTHT